jgi:outer membrane protein OmpA-like peptidoglycan-associated protein
MVENLIEMIQNSLTSKLAGDASSYLGESGATTRSAITAAIPAVLAGLAQQGSTAAGASQLFNTITSPQIDSALADGLGGWLGGGTKTAGLLAQGSSLLRGVFGERTGSVTEAISSVSGMKMSSASTLLGLAVPAIFAWLKRYLTQGRLDASALGSALAGQGDYLRPHLDDRVTSALGFATPAALLAGLTGSATAAAGRAADSARAVGSGAARTANTAYAATSSAVDRALPEPIERRGWFWGLLAAAAVVLLALFSYWRTPVQQTASTVQNAATTAASTAARAVRSLDLPSGVKISVTQGGFVDSLAAFLASPDFTAGRSFTFDDLRFETGSATLTADSDRQLDSLAAVLKAYGNVNVNVDGYTDNVGDAAANKKLSADRAASVKNALVSKGIDATRVTAQGFGEEKPLASNDTEDGRAKNRRVELVVLKR